MAPNAPGWARAGAPARLDELLGAVDAARRRAADEVLQDEIGNALLQPAEFSAQNFVSNENLQVIVAEAFRRVRRDLSHGRHCHSDTSHHVSCAVIQTLKL